MVTLAAGRNYDPRDDDEHRQVVIEIRKMVEGIRDDLNRHLSETAEFRGGVLERISNIEKTVDRIA